jgi:hypothetical protein
MWLLNLSVALKHLWLNNKIRGWDLSPYLLFLLFMVEKLEIN